MRLRLQDPKLGFLPQETASDGGGETFVARWYERLKGIVVRDAEPTSLAYRYMARLIEREFSREQSGLCLAFSSPEDDKVSTDAILMLAYSLRSELDSKVLIVDARLTDQRAGISGRLGLVGSPGYAEILREGFGGRDGLILASRVQNVDILPAGDPRGDAARALNLANLRQLLEAVRNRYDHVLVQLGSLLRDTRHVMAAAEADAVFLLAMENQSFMKGLDDCLKILRSNGVAQVLTVYGRIPKQTFPPIGTYQDTIVVTLTY